MQVIRKFVKKPLPVTILQYDGENHADLLTFAEDNAVWLPKLRQLRIKVSVRKESSIQAGINVPEPVYVVMSVGDILVKEEDGHIYVATVSEIQNGFDEALE
jgi:urease accessory protein UreE